MGKNPPWLDSLYLKKKVEWWMGNFVVPRERTARKVGPKTQTQGTGRFLAIRTKKRGRPERE